MSSTGLGFHMDGNVDLLFSRVTNPHLLPVVRKLLAAIETDNVRAGLGTGSRPLPSPAGDGEAHAFMPTSK